MRKTGYSAFYSISVKLSRETLGKAENTSEKHMTENC
jgi:hypothetical protein